MREPGLEVVEEPGGVALYRRVLVGYLPRHHPGGWAVCLQCREREAGVASEHPVQAPGRPPVLSPVRLPLPVDVLRGEAHSPAAVRRLSSVRGPMSPSGVRPWAACHCSTASGPGSTSRRRARARRRARRPLASHEPG